MTHILILQGGATETPSPSELRTTRLANAQRFGSTRIFRRGPTVLQLERIANFQQFGRHTLRKLVVRDLAATRLVNGSSIGNTALTLLPFHPVNDETEALLAAFSGSYTTTAKQQIDRLITELKSASVWGKLDWYGNAFWATTEHDALLDWSNPARSLVKVGGASWAPGQGLKGVDPMTEPGRYKSGWNVGDGPHSTATSFAMFCKITTIDVPQDGMQPLGLFELSSPGPSAPSGSFLILSIAANTGSAGGNVPPFNGNTGFAVGDGLGVWATTRSGSTNSTVRDGITLRSDTVAGTSGYTHPDGICVAGSGAGSGAQRSFPGTELYWGWGAALTASEFGKIESAFVNALLPPDDGPYPGALLVDGLDNYLIDEDGNYLVVEVP